MTALIRHTRDIAYMDDGELAILSRSGIRVYDRQLRPVEKKHHHVCLLYTSLREAKKRGARILSIVNVVGSSIARESDDVLYTLSLIHI